MCWVKKIICVGDFTDYRNIYRFTALQKPDRDDFRTKKEYQDYQIYASEYYESYGFDIKRFVRHRLGYMIILKPVPLSDSDEVYENCKKAVQSVLQYLDQKGEHKLDFVKITKANYCAEYMFFVTFEARDKISGETEVYQSKVHRAFIGTDTSLFIFKKRDEQLKIVLPLADKRSEYVFRAIKKQHVLSDFENEAAFYAYKKYVKQHNDSEGFDIEPVDNPDLLDRKMLLPIDNPDHCSEAVRMVLDYLNREEGKNLELVRVIKANYISTCGYYATFEAKDKNLGQEKVYQSAFYRNDEPDIFLFREKEEKLKSEEGVQVVLDEREHYKFLEVRKRDLEVFDDFDDYWNYQKHAEEVNDSEGFDFKSVVSDLDVGDRGRMLMRLHLSNARQASIFQHCKEAVEIVLGHLKSREEENLQLVRISKVNYRASYMFFVTFKAKNKVSGTVNEYQSAIFHEVHDGVHNVCDFTELHMFRRVIKERKRCTKTC